MKNRIDFKELVRNTTDKYTLRCLQREGFFTSEEDGTYDPRWVQFYHEAKGYMCAGFDEYSAYCEAYRDI